MPRKLRQPNYRLMTAIKAKGLKKGFIAQAIGVSDTTFSNWVNLGQKPEDTAKRQALAELLGVDVFAEGKGDE